jgi:DNA-binding IclR family transcriptional regulator
VTIKAVERAAVLLQLMAARGTAIGVSDVAVALKVAKSSAHELLSTLHQVGLIDQDDVSGRYRLGDAARRLAQGPLDANLLRSLATNWVDALAARSGESAYIGVLRGPMVEVIHHVFRPDDSPQRLEVGDEHGAHASAMGQVLLALDPSGQAVARSLTAPPLTRRTLSGDALAERLRTVRQQQWACAAGELTADSAGIAAPLRGRGGLVVAAVGLVGPIDTLTDARRRPRPALLALVQATATSISDDLTGTL